MYSTAFWCLFVVLLFFWLYCVTAVTPFIERSEGWSLRSGRVLDQSQQKCRFFRRNSNPQQIFQLQPKKETSPSSLGDRLEKKSIISPIKSSHLCRTSRHVWLSSSACDHCCAFVALLLRFCCARDATPARHLWYVNYITPFPRNVSLGRLCY